MEFDFIDFVDEANINDAMALQINCQNICSNLYKWQSINLKNNFSRLFTTILRRSKIMLYTNNIEISCGGLIKYGNKVLYLFLLLATKHS